MSPPWWSRPPASLLAELSHPTGLTAAEAADRRRRDGPNRVTDTATQSAWRSLLAQLTNPLVLLLFVAALISLAVGAWVDASIVLAIVLASSLLSWWQERRAGAALKRLRARVTVQATLLREGRSCRLPAEDIVRGDIVILSAGSLIPADGILLEAADCFVNQAALTGETFPVEKVTAPSPAAAALVDRTNAVYLGTHVRSGTARLLVVETGPATVFGDIAARLATPSTETDFERGLRQFGRLLTQAMAVLVLLVFAVHLYMGRPLVDGLTFAIALAVGIAPELLPAVLLVNLSRGAERMAAAGVIVRRLAAMEDIGSMDVLCTDKTGTLTAGTVHLRDALDPDGAPADAVLRRAIENARLQTGLSNPLDEALAALDPAGALPEKLDEIPYDFLRKRLSVVVRRGPDAAELITKGALESVLSACTTVDSPQGPQPLDAPRRAALHDQLVAWSADGARVLGVARRSVSPTSHFTRADEAGLTFLGYLRFEDPLKPGVNAAIADLAALGVGLKIITGDNRYVAAHLGQSLGLPPLSVLTGEALQTMSEEALAHNVEAAQIFAEVDPNQKERIIRALQRRGHVVGYLGDGINDAPALHAADVGISVEGAVDVAKEAADFVLLSPDLDVLRAGVLQGRTTFANTMKYVMTTESANLGNMLSMAAASYFLPFLPLLAKQILLNNFLSDFPAMAMATDAVDPELIRRPQRWDVHGIRRFMIFFGLISSAFDGLTFYVLLRVTTAGEIGFRTAWFVESLLTELAVALVVRTRRRAWQSRPGRALWVTSLAVGLLAIALPYLPVAAPLGFAPMPLPLLATVLAITAAYVATVELGKAAFYRWWSPTPR